MTLKKLSDLTGGLVPAKGSCSEHGDYECEVLVRDGKPEKPRCAICVQIDTQEQLRKENVGQLAERSKAMVKQRVERIGLPPRLIAKRYSDYLPQSEAAEAHLQTCKDFADNWLDYSDIGANLILCGKPGTGKTHLVSVMCRQIATQNEAQPNYQTASAMLRYIRGAYGSDSGYSEAQAIDSFIKSDLLVIDELGAKLPSEHDRATLFEIVDERYQQEKPTVVISNLSVELIEQQTDPRLVDRLNENGTLMIFDWESYRSRA